LVEEETTSSIFSKRRAAKFKSKGVDPASLSLSPAKRATRQCISTSLDRVLKASNVLNSCAKSFSRRSKQTTTRSRNALLSSAMAAAAVATKANQTDVLGMVTAAIGIEVKAMATGADVGEEEVVATAVAMALLVDMVVTAAKTTHAPLALLPRLISKLLLGLRTMLQILVVLPLPLQTPTQLMADTMRMWLGTRITIHKQQSVNHQRQELLLPHHRHQTLLPQAPHLLHHQLGLPLVRTTR
jgi:hypothetical protein